MYHHHHPELALQHPDLSLSPMIVVAGLVITVIVFLMLVMMLFSLADAAMLDDVGGVRFGLRGGRGQPCFEQF